VARQVHVGPDRVKTLREGCGGCVLPLLIAAAVGAVLGWRPGR
jgi:hypothetical protein